VAYGYLSLLRDRGVATTTGEGRAARWRLTTLAAPSAAPEDTPPASAYETIEALAKRVHDGLADVDDDTRAVLEQAREISARQRAGRPHLTVVRPPEDAAIGDGT
jgi:hypothetical protein